MRVARCKVDCGHSIPVECFSQVHGCQNSVASLCKCDISVLSTHESGDKQGWLFECGGLAVRRDCSIAEGLLSFLESEPADCDHHVARKGPGTWSTPDVGCGAGSQRGHRTVKGLYLQPGGHIGLRPFSCCRYFYQVGSGSSFGDVYSFVSPQAPGLCCCLCLCL